MFYCPLEDTPQVLDARVPRLNATEHLNLALFIGLLVDDRNGFLADLTLLDYANSFRLELAKRHRAEEGWIARGYRLLANIIEHQLLGMPSARLFGQIIGA